MTELSNNTRLYRAISYEDFIDPTSGKLDAQAFKRLFKKKLDRYEDHLSAALTPEDTYNTLGWCFGVIVFTVQDLRDLGLDAIQDQPDHVSIVNLPHPQTEKQLANRLAKKLAKKARIYARWSKEESQQIKKGKLDWRDFIVEE